MPPTCTYTLAADSAEAGALGASDDYCVPDTKEACEVAAKAAGLLVGCSVAAGCANDIAFSSASWPIKGCFAYPPGNGAATPLRGAAYFSPGTSEEKTQSVDGWEGSPFRRRQIRIPWFILVCHLPVKLFNRHRQSMERRVKRCTC